jgi:hypothetical protein
MSKTSRIEAKDRSKTLNSNTQPTETYKTYIIDHICGIYEPLRLALQTHDTLKAEEKIIPIVISRTSTFNVKILAEIAQLVSF